MDIRYIIPDHRTRLVMSNHKHHIVPKYKCKELGLTTSYKIDGTEFYFKENMVEVTREQHALIHWGYWCNDLSPLLEICNPPQWVIDMIPLEDVRDSGAAGDGGDGVVIVNQGAFTQSASASGVWSLQKQMSLLKQSKWPS
mgnify:CR=1 FL=1